MLVNDLDFRLESRIKELLLLHKERAGKIDWSYHEFLPWDKGQDFRRVPWDPSQVTLPPAIVTAVETALLTEINLPWFTSYLKETFKGSITAIQDFVYTWTSEEDQHSNLLETYLLLTRNVDPNRLHQLRKQTVEHGFSPDFHTPIETMAYTTIQELATQVFYTNVAKISGEHDRDLSALLRRLAKDESLHYAFYRDAVRDHLEIEPNYCYHLAHVIINFQMPGSILPDFEERMTVIGKEANYGPMEYFDQVLNVLVAYWGLEDLRPTSTEADNKRIEILKYRDRLKKMRDRYQARLQKL